MRRPIRVVSWNLCGALDRGGNGRAIRSVLVDARPDICGLQEVWADGERNFASELAEELELQWAWVGSPEPEEVAPTSPRCSADVGHAILAMADSRSD